MLIVSPRHRSGDLALWGEMEAADRVHGERLLRSDRPARSAATIREFASAGPSYCSVSWGKDSVVLAHLVLSECPAVPLVRFRSGEDKYPGDDQVRDAFLLMHPAATYHEFVVDWPQRGAADWRRREALAEDRLGTRRRFVGIRAEEAAGRALSVARHGPSTVASCRPLAYWSTADVFGFLAARGLPVHPAYAMTGGGRWPRDRLRVSGLGGQPGTAIGRAEWEAEYYGDMRR